MAMNRDRVRGKPATILLVEDDPAHCELVIRSFAEHRVANKIHIVHDGEAALDYLFRRGAYASPEKSPRPCVVLLDLRLPKIDGLEVLKEVRASNEVGKTPIVILTTSKAEEDVGRAYAAHVSSYLLKPLNFAKFSHLMDELGSYWLGCNHHPSC